MMVGCHVGEVDVEPCGVSLFPPMCPSSASQFHSPGRLFSSSSNGHTNVELSVTSYSGWFIHYHVMFVL